MSSVDKEIEQFIQEVLGRKPKTDLEHLVEGYRLCARSEGKSGSTIALVEAAVRYLVDFLKANSLSTDVREIGREELRRHLGRPSPLRRRQAERPTGLP